ncbi:peptidase M50 [Anopheles sinensis]|uniref:Peptidase M50 n=1 Tax=Anopheles sinensis TaxID=74873 RepID=A0A084WI26_ANOSI|nr:peptidase M50 [Anopheles sinensis]
MEQTPASVILSEANDPTGLTQPCSNGSVPADVAATLNTHTNTAVPFPPIGADGQTLRKVTPHGIGLILSRKPSRGSVQASESPHLNGRN